MSAREPRDAGRTEERAERGTSEHATREGRGQSAANAVRETQSTRQADIERRLRAAFDAEAADVAPHPGAWAENVRRLRGSGRRRRRFPARFLAIPATTAATAAVIMVGFALHPEREVRHPQPVRPAAPALPPDLDPKYRPSGPVVPASDGSRTAWWFTGHGANTMLCWRLATGGGDCRSRPALPAGRHAAYMGLASLGPDGEPAGKARRPWNLMAYGVTDGNSGRITLTLPDGTRRSSLAGVAPGPALRIWSITFAYDPAKLSADGRLTVADGQGKLPGVGARPAADLIHPRPLTTGVPVFSYRAAGGQTVTMHVFVDGNSLQLGHGASVPETSGRGKSFGSMRRLDKSIDHPWLFGFLSPRMARVELRLADGRTVPARIVRAGPYRVFAVELVDERPGDRGGRDLVLSYDAAGKRLATWPV